MIGTYSTGGTVVRVYRPLLAGAFALVGIALAPASALAATDPTEDQYSDTLQLVSQGGGSGGSAGGVEDVGGLPFTGLDVVALAAVGFAICLAGVLLHRRARRDLARGAA